MMASDSEDQVCVVCKDIYEGSHYCRECKEPCHSIPPCGIVDEEDEGFGKPVLCRNCAAATKSPASPSLPISGCEGNY